MHQCTDVEVDDAEPYVVQVIYLNDPMRSAYLTDMMLEFFDILPSFCMFCLCGRYLIASFPKDFKISYARWKSKCFSRTGCWVHWNLNLWFIHCFAGRLPDPTWRPLVVRNLSNPSVLAVDEQNKRLQKSASRTDDSLVEQDYNLGNLGGIRNKMERFRY